uniref:Reverse transcriptase domain-containing protein n=1 Tax=Tanacetum cinerariifolium TaxID=118510 RepID=A0A6L2JGS5_TANCI|nr:reverse transcriptase domain-containing protein [Tanacetum cinerariifolium]
MNASTSSVSPDVAELKDMVKALLLDKKSQNQSPAPVKAVKESCVTCGGAHSYHNCPASDGNMAVVAKVNSSSSATAISFDVAKHKDMVRPLLLDKKNQSSAPVTSPTPAPIKAVASNCVTCGGTHSYQNCPATSGNVYQDNIQEYVSQAASANYNQGNTGFRPQMEDLKGITARSGVAYQGPTIPTPSKVIKQGTEVTKDQVQTPSSQSTSHVQPPVTQSETPVSEPDVAPVSAPMPNLKPSIPYPSRRDNERGHEQANEQIEKFYEIFKDMSFEISFMDALILMPKFASTLKAFIGNKEKLSEMDRTLMNEHCSAVILNKLPKKLGDLGKFLIPCEFLGMDECLALADLGASINLMPLSVWKEFALPELTPTCITLELADHSVSKPIGIAKDVSVKTGRALIDVHKDELTLRIGNEAITYNLDQTSRYSTNYDQMTANKIDVTDEDCEEYFQEVLGFSDVTTSSSPTPSDDPIVSTTSPMLTSFGDSDFLLFEEANAFLGLEDDLDSPEFNPSYYDQEGDILMLEAILNSDPTPVLPNHEQSVPSFTNKLKACEAKTIKSSVDEPPEVELKDLPPHLEYAFLEGDNTLPIIIAKELGDEEKAALIKVLKSHKRAIAWKLSDIQGINPEFYTHKILMEEDYKPANEENELISTRLVTGWRVCIDYRKLNEATRKGHFPLPFMDQMLERLAGNEYYCFLYGFSGYFQIPIDPRDQEKTTFTCPYGTFAYSRMPFGLCNAPGTFHRCMLAIFHDMVEKTMEVYMDDFSVFGKSFETCLSRLDKMLQRCEDTKLCLNWEKSHFMVKKGIVLDNKISRNGIEIDKAKVDVINKLPHLTTVKGWAYAFHQDKASSVRIPVANVTLFSSFPLFAIEVSLGLVFLLGLSVFAMVAACSSRAAAIPSAISYRMAGAADSSGGVMDLTGDEDHTDKDGDTRMDYSIGVSTSLGGEISSREKKFRESNSDNTEGTTVGEAIEACSGGIGLKLASLIRLETPLDTLADSWELGG